MIFSDREMLMKYIAPDIGPEINVGSATNVQGYQGDTAYDETLSSYY